MGTFTPNLNLYKPANAEIGWGDEVDANFDVLDGIGADALKAHYIWANVTEFGAAGDNVTDDAAAIQAAFDSGYSAIYFPLGDYHLADGASITVPSTCQRIIGAGPKSTIRPKNAYAFVCDGNGPVIEHISIKVGSGATSGGAIFFENTSTCGLNYVFAEGVTTTTDPLVYYKGTIDNRFIGCIFRGSKGPGLRLDNLGDSIPFCNANKIIHTTINNIRGSTSTAALHIGGGANNVFRDGHIESVDGYGVYADGGSVSVIGSWFEDVNNHNVLVTDGNAQSLIMGNNMYAGYAEFATGYRVKLEDMTSSTTMTNDRVLYNNFPDQGAVYVGTNRLYTQVIGNMKLAAANLDDNGLGTTRWGNSDASTPAPAHFPEALDPPFRVKSNRTAAASGGSLASAEALFYVTDETDTNYLLIGSRGYPIFHTGSTLTSSDELATKSFAFFYDPADSKIKARIRHSDGTYFTSDVT